MRHLFPLAILLTLGFGCTSTDTISSNTATSSEATPTVTLVDMHAHIYPTTEKENAKYVDDIVAAGKAKGVSQIVLGLNARAEPERPPTYSSEHDLWVLEAAKRYPGFIIPALNGFDPNDPAAVDYVKEQLASGQWKMIGELDLRNRPKKTTTPANTDILMQIYALAGQYDLPVMMHFDLDYGTDKTSGLAELTDALAKNPDTNFIMAHQCGPDVATLMASFQNFYCEQEFGPLAPGIDMKRVVLGTDIQVHGDNPSTAADDYQKLLDKLHSAVASWSKADIKQAAIETPSALLHLP